MEERDGVLGNMVRAIGLIESCPDFTNLIPEVRVNLVYALPWAQGIDEVAGVEGRISALRGWPRACGVPAFGASSHMARLVLEVRHYDKAVNAGINFRCDDEVISVAQDYAAAKHLGFGYIDRTQEPPAVAQQEGASMAWKIRQLKERYGTIPTLFYEGPGWGKEPIFVALGSSAVEATQHALEIARLLTTGDASLRPSVG